PNANETKLLELSATHVRNYWPCVAPHAWQWDGVWFEWMSPDASVLAANGWPSPAVRLRNAQSCVLRVSNAHGVLWLMGDVGKAQEAAIAQRLAAREPKVTGLMGRDPVVVLVAGHHGSATSSSEAWLRFVRPDWVVAQAGYANPYGHPSAEVVQRLQRLAPLWRMQWRDTAHCGAALWRSADAQHLHCEREAWPKHWQHRP
ncbi:MAG: hypothetical protein NWS83_06365, partial [Burkholderiaceae bacterium]|nr:hypothetical protein [Burkholderiaceae bacterium]